MKSNILAVDDNINNLQVLGNILKEAGYRVAVAKNASETHSLIPDFKPDLLLLDIMMPDIDGLELARAIKAKPDTAEIPIVFVTAKNATEDVVKGFETGGVDYITKPFNKEELLVRVKNQLDLQNAKRIIARQTDDLKEIMHSRDKLYSIIAHDIRSPLSSIMMLMQSLQSDDNEFTKEELQQNLFLIGRSTSETLALLDNLLLWGKSQGGKLRTYPENLDLAEISYNVMQLLKPSAQIKNITLKNEVTPTHLVRFDQNALHTIIRNLISNALKFTHNNGTITVHSSASNDNTMLHVSDTGIGIPADKMEALFNMNEVITSTGTANEKGSGLGIKLCLELCNLNGAKLSAQSQTDQGSTFTITCKTIEKEEPAGVQ